MMWLLIIAAMFVICFAASVVVGCVIAKGDEQ